MRSPNTPYTLTHHIQRATPASPSPGLLGFGSSSLLTGIYMLAVPREPDHTQAHYHCVCEAT